MCLLLIVSLLYNPFLMSMAPSADLVAISHGASHRATVGSSELQHYPIVNAQEFLSCALFLAVLFLVAVVLSEGPSLILVSPNRVISPRFLGGPILAIRPPPVLV